MLNELKTFAKTLVFFIIACFMLPVLLLTSVLQYPTLTLSKSKKIRSLIDTSRNAGIFHFLLRVRGPCDFGKIQQKYAEHLLDKRDKSGLLKFPKLRQPLITCWGQYAWVKDTSLFNINNHVLLNERTFRGRPVSDANIQDFVSELITKYLPAELPQWQIIIIPTYKSSNELNIDDHYYILVKVHHLIIGEEQDLHISELLMLQSTNGRQSLELDESNQTLQWQHLAHFVRKPLHIENLCRHLRNFIIKQWNAFIYEFDSLESHDGCHATITVNSLTKLFSLLLIIVVNVLEVYWKSLSASKQQKRRSRLLKDKNGRQQNIKTLFLIEIEKRNLSWSLGLTVLRASLHPANIAAVLIKLVVVLVIGPILLPFYVLRELLALLTLVFRLNLNLESTYCEQMYFCGKLFLRALWECLEICYILFKAPLNIYEELFEKPTDEPNILQVKSYSGRKIVSFSKSLDAVEIKRRNIFGAKINECDFVLACLAAAIRDYFALYQSSTAIPEILNTTCRTISKSYFTDREGDKFEHIGGVVFLQLPLSTPDLRQIQQIHQIIENIRNKQTIIYLASIGQTKFDLLTALLPQVITKVFINYFSYNFPVTITDIHGPRADFQTIWGQAVDDVLLFRPPQSKTC